VANKTLRTFLALPLGQPAAARLEAAARARLRGPDAPSRHGGARHGGARHGGARHGGAGRWRAVPAGRLHLTLKFLGATDSGLRPGLRYGLVAALQEAARAIPPGARFGFEGWRLLPNERKPGVLAVTVSDPAGTLSRVAWLLEEEAAALGFPREDRAFLPHVTVARLRHRSRGDPRTLGGRRTRRDRVPDAGARDVGARGAGAWESGCPVPRSASLSWKSLPAWEPNRLTWFESVSGTGGLPYRVLAEEAVGDAVVGGTGFDSSKDGAVAGKLHEVSEQAAGQGRDGRSSSERES